MSFKTNVQVIYKRIPEGLPSVEKDFEIKKSTIVLKDVVLKPNEVLVRTLYASVDPYMRGRMRDPSVKSYFPAAVPGAPMTGGIIAEVLRSTDDKVVAGDVVLAFGSWEEYSVISTAAVPGSPSGVKKIPGGRDSKVPLSYFLGVLGMPGLTAYVGLHKICEPLTAGQTLYVSAASGAVGQVVGQYGKSLGLRVVGSAGDEDKVKYLLNELKFDAAFNYKKHDDFEAILKETCPNGIDIYFENVGGKMLDAVLVNCNNNARIAVCGMISQYNRSSDPEPIYNASNIIWKKLKLEGFIVSDDIPKYGDEALKAFSKLLQQGKLIYKETVTEGIEKLPQAFVDMLQGKNFGKAVVKIADLS
jgi:NADPH-dependent curcumin reductase CurA